MGSKLYVGNLPYSATEAEIERLFSQAGEVVEVSIITDRETGRARGFGFVEMADEAGARAAVEQFDGTQMGGRTLKVNEARPRESRSGGGGGGGGYGGGGGSRDRDYRGR